MTTRASGIGRASEQDLEGIVALQTANQPEHGGTLSANLGQHKIAAMMREMPLADRRPPRHSNHRLSDDEFARHECRHSRHPRHAGGLSGHG